MKVLLLVFSLFTVSVAFGGSHISLEPGASVTVNAGETVSLKCSGSNSNIGNPQCFVLVYGQSDSFGAVCGRNRCGRYYKYGTIAQEVTDWSLNDIIKWCDARMTGEM